MIQDVILLQYMHLIILKYKLVEIMQMLRIILFLKRIRMHVHFNKTSFFVIKLKKM